MIGTMSTQEREADKARVVTTMRPEDAASLAEAAADHGLSNAAFVRMVLVKWLRAHDPR